MINETVMNHLFDSFEEMIKRVGIDCMCMADRRDFLQAVYENGMRYDGFVIIKSSKQFGIFYVDTELFSGNSERFFLSYPMDKSKLDVPSNNIFRLNSKAADIIDMNLKN